MSNESADPTPPHDSGNDEEAGVAHTRSCVLFGLLVVGGGLVSGALSLVFGMSSDACGSGTTGWICQSPGQQLAVWLPWIALTLAIVRALTGFAFSKRSDTAPSIGLGVGILAYIVVVALEYDAVNAVTSR